MNTISNCLPTPTSGFSHHLCASFCPAAQNFPSWELRSFSSWASAQPVLPESVQSAAAWMSSFDKQENPLWKFPLSILVTSSNLLSLLTCDNSGVATFSGFPVLPAEAASTLPFIHILHFSPPKLVLFHTESSNPCPRAVHSWEASLILRILCKELKIALQVSLDKSKCFLLCFGRSPHFTTFRGWEIMMPTTARQFSHGSGLIRIFKIYLERMVMMTTVHFGHLWLMLLVIS